MTGIGIISNPHAKVNRNDPEYNTLIWYVLGNRGQFEVTNTLEDLQNVCENFSSQGIDHVGIIGGDGTVSRTLSALLRAYNRESLPKILILRGGTVNVLATNLGIYGQPKDILADFLDFFHSGKALFEMSVRSLLVDEQLGFLVGTGGTVRFLKRFYENKTSALGAGRFFASVMLDGLASGHFNGEFPSIVEPENLKLESVFDGHTSENTISTPALLLSSLPRIPYGFEFFPELAKTGDYAAATYVTGQGGKLVRDIAAALFTKNKAQSSFRRFHFQNLKIQFEENTEYTLDGEIAETKNRSLLIELGPIFKFCSPYGKMLDT